MATPIPTISPADIVSILQTSLQAADAVNGKMDSLIFMMTLLAAVFGVIIAIVLAFFTIKQINVDKEIREYKNDIKEQRELIIKENSAFRSKLAEEANWIEKQKEKIEKALAEPNSGQKKELEKLKNDLEKLQEEVTYKRGSISATGPYVFSPSSSVVAGGWGVAVNFGIITCKKCNQTYTDNNPPSFTRISGSGSTLGLFTEDEPHTTCPHCGNVN